MRKWSFLGAVFMQPHTAGRPSFRDTLLPGLPPPVYTFLLCDSSSVCSFSRCLSGFCLDLFCSVSPSWIIWDLHSNHPPPPTPRTAGQSGNCPGPAPSPPAPQCLHTQRTSVPATCYPGPYTKCLPWALFFFPHGLSCTCFQAIKSLSAGDSSSQLSQVRPLQRSHLPRAQAPVPLCLDCCVTPAWSPCPCLSSFSACWGHYPKRQICCHLSALKHVH